ncbi:MmgE/PrpD family protein [Robertmurraya massiliosenegalensis]|uniref:MmgE/PrpD family protein n=1 Tax=Robertmurraya TaxID=2837507 RepID=UPI0039A75519
MTILKQTANFIVNSAFTKEEQELALHHLVDTCSALICGCHSYEGRKLLNAFNEEKDLFGDKGALNEIFLYSSLIRLTEVDDIHLPSCTTPGSVVVPTILAFVPYKNNISFETITDALIVGYEMLTRLGRVIDGANILSKGIWPSYFCASFGAAATAARLLGLSEEETVHALTLSLTLSAGGVSRSSVDTFRWLALGKAAESGAFAASMASRGFKGDPEMLENNWIEKTYGIAADSSKLVQDLGVNHAINDMSMKPYCSAKQVIPALHGFENIMKKGVLYDDIEEIKITVPNEFVKMTDHGAFDRVSSLTSIPYQLALLLFEREDLFDLNRSSLLETPEVLGFMKKITIVGDRSYSKLYPEKWVSKVECYTKTGVVTEYIEASTGDPEKRLNKEDILDKNKKLLMNVPEKESIMNNFSKLLIDDCDKQSILNLTKDINRMIFEVTYQSQLGSKL